MRMLGAKFGDDRGREVDLIDVASSAAWRGKRDPRLRPMWDAVNLKVAMFVLPALFAAMAVSIGVWAVLGSILAGTAVHGVVQSGHWVVALMTLLIIGGTRAVPAYWRRMARSVATITLREGVCPQCTNNLHGIVPDADGRLTCPECGARKEDFEMVQV